MPLKTLNENSPFIGETCPFCLNLLEAGEQTVSIKMDMLESDDAWNIMEVHADCADRLAAIIFGRKRFNRFSSLGFQVRFLPALEAHLKKDKEEK